MESNYWVCDIGHHFSNHNPDLTNWFGVVSEEHGGIIAYFNTEDAALRYSQLMESVTV